jgi:hypothetical protein
LICNRCGHELPSDTPVCRSCGPVTLNPGSGALPPLPPVSYVVPALTVIGEPTPSPLRAAASELAPSPVVARTPGPPTPSSPKPPRQSKAQRRRAALAGRTDTADAAPSVFARPANATATGDLDEPSLEGFSRPRPVTLLAKLDLAVGAAGLVAAAAILTGRVATESAASGPVGHGVFLAATSALSLVAAAGLFLAGPVGWYAHLALVASGVLWGSWADVAGVATAVYLLRPGVKLLLSGQDRSSFPPAQRARVRKDAPSPLLVPLAVAFLGIVAALRLLPVLWLILSRS